MHKRRPARAPRSALPELMMSTKYHLPNANENGYHSRDRSPTPTTGRIEMPSRYLLPVGLVLATTARAAGEPEFALMLRDHRFAPAEIAVPANVKVRIVIDNQDPTPEEFDSHSMNREKVIPGRSKAVIFIGPLAPGRYPFMGEFNAATAQGAVVAR
jgi:hypothetical protein